MKSIYILALHGVRTGGPEATHQLSDALITQGFDARMVYFDFAQIGALEQAAPQDGYLFGARANPIEEYAHYKTNVVDSVPNSPDVVVVLPETLCHLAPKFNKATVLVWWLSVDNAFGALSKVNLNHLRASNVRHAWQSVYARNFLAALGMHGQPLSDYTVDMSNLSAPLPWPTRPKLIAFNAGHKVTTDMDMIARLIRDGDQEIEFTPVRGERLAVAKLFARARVYLDLGCFPGKDRMPREAAAMGCRVLVAPRGAGATDLQNYTLTQHAYWPDTIRSAVNDAEFPRTILRGGVGSERATFFSEAREVFAVAA